MYKYNLNISIFSENGALENVISSIEPLDKFTHDIKRYEKLDGKAMLNSDILIWDFPTTKLFEFKNFFKDEAKIIVCSNNYSEELSCFDGIFLKPFCSGFVKYSFEQILQKIKLEEDLRYTENCFNTAIDSMPDMFWIKSLDGIHTLVNQEFCNVVGKTKEDVTGKDHYYIWNVSPDDPNSGADVCKKTEDSVIAARKTLHFNESVKSQKGLRQLGTYKTPIYDKNGVVLGTIGFGQDITDLKNKTVENEILFNSSPNMAFSCDQNHIIQNVNHAFEKYFGVKKEDLIGKPYIEWFKDTFNSKKFLNEDGDIEIKIQEKTDEEKTLVLKINDITDTFKKMTGQIFIFSDVTKEREAIYTDSMTKAYNKRYLDTFVSQQKIGTKVTLFSIDLDHFKSVNDTYGHKAGDNAIILTAATLKECVTPDVVVRLGGDEFLIVKVGEHSIDEIKDLSQNILDKLIENFGKVPEFSKLTASIGICQGTVDENGIETTLQHSDAALYEAKGEGRACYRVYKEKQLIK